VSDLAKGSLSLCGAKRRDWHISYLAPRPLYGRYGGQNGRAQATALEITDITSPACRQYAQQHRSRSNVISCCDPAAALIA
jgi:hypothetical protein